MIRYFKQKAKNILEYRPLPNEGHIKIVPYLFVNFALCLTPHAVRTVMSKNYKLFNKGPIMHELLDSLMGETLFTLDDKKWKKRRGIFNQWYSEAVANKTIVCFLDILQRELDRLEKGKEFNLAYWNREIMTAAFSRAMLGVSEEKAIVINTYKSLEDLFFIRMVFRLLKIKNYRTPAFVRQIQDLRLSAAQSLKELPKDKEGYIALLQDLLTRGEMTEEEAVSEIISNYSSAVTTALSLGMLTMHLINNSALWNADPEDDALMQSICMESTRLTPTTYVLFRQANENVVIEGCPIRKGTHVVIPIETVQRNAEFLPDADRFCPARFNDIDKEALQNIPWFSFGTGPRQCPGKNLALNLMKTYLKEMLKRGIRLSPGAQWPPQFDRGLVLEPKNNEMWVKIT